MNILTIIVYKILTLLSIIFHYFFRPALQIIRPDGRDIMIFLDHIVLACILYTESRTFIWVIDI